jgi:protein TonB
LPASLPALPFGVTDDGELNPAQRCAVVLGILALHGLAFCALLQVDAVRQAVQQVAPIFVSWVAPAEPAQPPKPLTQPPKPLPKLQPLPKTPPLIAAPAAPAPESFVVSATPAPPTPPAVTAPPAQAAVVEAASAAPAPRQLPDSAVQFLQLPEVVYPRLSQRQGEIGRVVVRAYIGTGGGAPHSVQIEKSSGHARLDQAALAAVQKARFKPYAEKGQPVEGWALVPIQFELEK